MLEEEQKKKKNEPRRWTDSTAMHVQYSVQDLKCKREKAVKHYEKKISAVSTL